MTRIERVFDAQSTQINLQLQGFPKLTKSCSYFPKKVLTRADLESRL